MINIELLDNAIRHIEEHPNQWDQRHWRCGTGMCLAGHIATLAGGLWVSDTDDLAFAVYLRPVPDDNPGHVDEFPDAVVHVEQRAQRLLGVNQATADELFDTDNDIDDIKRIRDRIAAGGDVA